MLAVLMTGVMIPKGYQDEPAIKVSDSGKAAWFRVGKKVYDPQAKDNRRWINLDIKGFSYMVERIQKMQFKEGVYVNIRGRLDEDVWEDSSGATRKNWWSSLKTLSMRAARPRRIPRRPSLHVSPKRPLSPPRLQASSPAMNPSAAQTSLTDN